MRSGVGIIIICIVTALVVDGALFLLLPKRCRRKWRLPYAVFTLLCWALLITSLRFMPWRISAASLEGKMWFLYTWLSIYVVKLNVLFWQLIGLMPGLWKGSKLRLGLYIGLPIGLVCFGMMWWGATAGRRMIDVVRVDAASPLLPQAFDGFRIAQISDLHVGTWGSDTTFISKLVDSVNSQHADLIVFTGDMVNRDAREITPFTRILSRLRAPYGVISIMGNHDYGGYRSWPNKAAKKANEQLLRTTQHDMGWLMLNNAHITLHRGNDSIVIVGVENWGEPPYKGTGDLDIALKRTPLKIHILDRKGSEYKVLLSHNPEHWRQRVRHESNVALTLSGHTHAMQFIVGCGKHRFSPAVWHYPTWGGLYGSVDEESTSLLYVNIGAGEVGLPFRIGATPEITIITLTRTSGTAPTLIP